MTEDPQATDTADGAPSGPDDGGVWSRFVDQVVHSQTLLTTGLSLVTALLIGAVLIVLSEDATREPMGYLFSRPSDFVVAVWQTVGDAYRALFSGAVLGTSSWSETLTAATPLIFTGLAFALPFRALIINIGAEGQFLAGALSGAIVGFSITGVPMVVHLPLTILAGFAGGALYGYIPGILKAKTGAHEVITTIMLNNIAILLTNYLLLTELYQRPDRPDPISKAIAGTATLPKLFGSTYRAHWGFVFAVAVAVAAWWLLERSTFGFEVKAVGHNPRASMFSGMSPDRIYWMILSLAGAMAALGGIVQIAGVQPRITPGFSAGLGFDGITVALLGRSKPIGVIWAALLIGGLRAGGLSMQAQTGISLDLVTVVQALIIIFIAAPALIRAIYRVRTARAGIEAAPSGGWSA